MSRQMTETSLFSQKRHISLLPPAQLLCGVSESSGLTSTLLGLDESDLELNRWRNHVLSKQSQL